MENVFLNFDWQLNTPLGNDYASRISGSGASADSGYFLTKNIGVGAYVSYHTNRKYISKETRPISNSTDVTADQQHSLFQLPFGASVRYSFTPEKVVQPYFALKLGTTYSKASSYMNVFQINDKQWGFNISPEIGTTIYVDPMKRYRIHFFTYYSYSTNKSELIGYTIDDISNWVVRLGIAF